MNLSSILKALKAAGATDDMLIAAVEADERARLEHEEQKTAKRRADGARRQRAYQERKDTEKRSAKSDVSDASDVLNASETVRSVIATEPYKDKRAPACVNPEISLTGNINTPLPTEGPQGGVVPAEPKPTKRSSGAALPENWRPPEELFVYGSSQGLTREQTASILEDMRLWAVSNRNRSVARKADWITTAQGWIRRDALKFKARAGPQDRGGWGQIAEDVFGDQDGGTIGKSADTREAVRLLPIAGGRSEKPSGGDASGLSGNPVWNLASSSFRRM